VASTLLNDLRTYLVAQGVARVPRTAGSAPPLWLEPRNGVPAPGEGQNSTERGADAVLGVYLNPAGGIPARPFESSMRADVIELRYRTSKASVAADLEQQVRAALIDKRDLIFGSQRVIDIEEWRALTRIGSDDQGFEFLSSYVIWQYA
jgi:hypothetical protein